MCSLQVIEGFADALADAFASQILAVGYLVEASAGKVIFQAFSVISMSLYLGLFVQR